MPVALRDTKNLPPEDDANDTGVVMLDVPEDVPEPPPPEPEPIEDDCPYSVDSLDGLGAVSARLCRMLGVESLEGLSRHSAKTVLSLTGCGPKTYEELEGALHAVRLRFADALQERTHSEDWFDWSKARMSKAMMETQITWAVNSLFQLPRGLVAKTFVDRVRATVSKCYPHFRLSTLHRAMLAGDGQSIVVKFPDGHQLRVDWTMWLLDVIETMAVEDGGT